MEVEHLLNTPDFASTSDSFVGSAQGWETPWCRRWLLSPIAAVLRRGGGNDGSARGPAGACLPKPVQGVALSAHLQAWHPREPAIPPERARH